MLPFFITNLRVYADRLNDPLIKFQPLLFETISTNLYFIS